MANDYYFGITPFTKYVGKTKLVHRSTFEFWHSPANTSTLPSNDYDPQVADRYDTRNKTNLSD